MVFADRARPADDELSLAAHHIDMVVARHIPQASLLRILVSDQAQHVGCELEKLLGVDERHVEGLRLDALAARQLVRDYHAARAAAEDDDALLGGYICGPLLSLDRCPQRRFVQLRAHRLDGRKEERLHVRPVGLEGRRHLHCAGARADARRIGKEAVRGIHRSIGLEVVRRREGRATVRVGEGILERAQGFGDEESALGLVGRCEAARLLAEEGRVAAE